MDKKKQWVKIQRSIIDNWVYKQKPFDKCHAWLDLILLAEYKTEKKMWRGSLTEFKRGDVCLSIEKLAERWGWSRNKVRHFLAQLEGDEMVHLNAHQRRTTITLVNYGLYQNKGTSDGTPKGTSKGTSESTVKRTSEGTYLKNIKEDKENIEEGAARNSSNSTDEPSDFLDGFVPMTDEEWEALPDV